MRWATNPLDEVMTFTYGSDSEANDYQRLQSISGDVPGGNQAFTYDGYGRINTVTSTDGYTLTYDYDDLDRVRTVTYPDASTVQYVLAVELPLHAASELAS